MFFHKILFIALCYKANFLWYLSLLSLIKVWGCGGEEAVDSQKKVKEWEKKEIQRRRKVGMFVPLASKYRKHISSSSCRSIEKS